MNATTKNKVVTSGRLTGRVKVQLTRKQLTPNPGSSLCPEPSYSLYSLDSEDQVTYLHKGLDHCAALLGDILQGEKAALTSPPRMTPCGAAKSRPSTSLGKKTMKKLPRKTALKSSSSCQRVAGSTTPGKPQSMNQATHSGVKLHPSRRPTAIKSHRTCSIVQPHSQTATSPHQPQTCNLLTVHQSSSQPGRPKAPHTSHCDLEHDDDGEEEFVPVRDIDRADKHTISHVRSCGVKESHGHLEPGQVDEIPQEAHSEENCRATTDVQATTVQYLVGKLKALISGQGTVAERLLYQLELAVTSPLLNEGSSNIQTESGTDLLSLRSQNIQLCRRVRILNQQLMEKERQQNVGMLSNCEATSLQEELTAAQSQLQELQHDLTELREVLQDTQSQLRGREAQVAVVRTDLEATRSRLVEVEREKSDLALFAKQRLEEIVNLKRKLQSQGSSACPAVADTSVPDTLPMTPHQPPTERITQYLMSLSQVDVTNTEQTATQRIHPPVHVRDDDKPAATPSSHVPQPHCLGEVQSQGRQLDSMLSHCEVDPLWSNCSMRSGSTYDTRDEAAFRDGLAALDASIASLQKTIQLDMKR